MAKGGARPGAGRPPGQHARKTQELLAKVTAEGISPIEVLLNDMRFFYNLGESMMMEASQTEPGKKQATAFRAASELKGIARECAKDVAPYIHPKLASIEANVNVTGQESRLSFLK